MESGFVEGWRVNDWVHGGDELSELLATGITFLMGLVIPMRNLEWMREHNRSAARPVSFYGVDLAGLVCVIAAGHRRGDRLPAPG